MLEICKHNLLLAVSDDQASSIPLESSQQYKYSAKGDLCNAQHDYGLDIERVAMF